MKQSIQSVAFLALLLGAPGAASAQEQAPGSAMPDSGQEMPQEQMAPGSGSGGGDNAHGMRRGAMRHGMMDHGGGHGGMKHGEMMGHGGMGGMRMMMIMADTDEDGALSLEEMQAVHARFFRAIDADGDERVTLEEIQSFMTGGAGMRQQP